MQFLNKKSLTGHQKKHIIFKSIILLKLFFLSKYIPQYAKLYMGEISNLITPGLNQEVNFFVLISPFGDI